ncbi:hypothetical protein L1887_14043 [Cichorium endivia]|nr:hypothetical protein L1887_14043 [Cichorium endivia]
MRRRRDSLVAGRSLAAGWRLAGRRIAGRRLAGVVVDSSRKQVTFSGYRMAADCACSALLDRLMYNKNDAEKFRSDLMRIAKTTFSSKILSQDKEHFFRLSNFKEISDADYFSKNNEFSTWLKDEREIFFSDLSSESARKLFAEFRECPPVPYSTSDFGDMNGNPATTFNGDVAASNSSNTMDVDNSNPHEAPSSTTQDVIENPASNASISLDSSHVTAYHSSMNGNDFNDAKSLGISKNGVGSYDDDTSASANEAARWYRRKVIWSIVNTNSLDFTAWTALIEETQKTTEKKYDDHEARLGFLDKVVEVYERAVDGVTYSVDMWLHYCVFVINTYGDLDTVCT